jgi:hypothetical protein
MCYNGRHWFRRAASHHVVVDVSTKSESNEPCHSSIVPVVHGCGSSVIDGVIIHHSAWWSLAVPTKYYIHAIGLGFIVPCLVPPTIVLCLV